jgi:hypothetical protein
MAEKDSIKVYRHELKYFLGFHDYQVASGILKDIMKPDPFAGPNGDYWIRSLYFDSIEDRDYYDKMLGLSRRKKIRLRLYDPAQQTVKLEVKNKYNEYMMKETATLPAADAMELIHGNRGVLLRPPANPTLHKVFYLMSQDYYLPKVIVDYEREAYIGDLQNLRVTFDKNIRASFSNTDIFNPSTHMAAVFDSQTMVMEVKYDRFLPGWLQDILATFTGQRYAISKYCLSRALY